MNNLITDEYKNAGGSVLRNITSNEILKNVRNY